MMVYGSVAGVEGINAHRVNGYGPTTHPSTYDVMQFIEDGAAAIETALAKAGYGVPVPEAATCYGVAVRLNNLYAAAAAEEAAAVSLGGPEGEGRSARLWQRYKDGLAELLAGDLTKAGLSATTTATGGNRYVRSRELRRRDGYAHRYDASNSEYGSTAEE